MKETFEKDSEFLRKSGLIDYSVFLVEVDRSKMLSPKNKNSFKALVYNAKNKQYVMKES